MNTNTVSKTKQSSKQTEKKKNSQKNIFTMIYRTDTHFKQIICFENRYFMNKKTKHFYHRINHQNQRAINQRLSVYVKNNLNMYRLP